MLTIAGTGTGRAVQHRESHRRNMMQESESTNHVQAMNYGAVNQVNHLNNSVFSGCTSKVQLSIRMAKFAQSSSGLV